MERITYRITLDAHRNGIQRMLQGFQTADKVARRISINLVAGGDTYELPMTDIVAIMYVTTPNATQPSISECVIDGNAIIYDVEPLTVEGITEMQLKVIGTSIEGATNVLTSPKFAVEVTKSDVNDEGAVQSPTFTALENALANANAVYNSRVTSIEITDDFTFRVYYADGSYYESSFLKATLNDGNVKMSKSYAVGDAGVRAGENTDNSKYYSQESKSASEQAKKIYEESVELVNEVKIHTNYTHFQVNFDTGELGYVSANTQFNINKETGQLETNRNDAYTPEDIILGNAEELVRDVVHDVVGADDGEVATKSDINALRGDTSNKTVAGAYELAESMLKQKDVIVIEGSLDFTVTTDEKSTVAFVDYPEGVTADNCCLIGCMCRLTDNSPWFNLLPWMSSGTEVSFVLNGSVYFRENYISLNLSYNTISEGTHHTKYKLVLLKTGLG